MKASKIVSVTKLKKGDIFLSKSLFRVADVEQREGFVFVEATAVDNGRQNRLSFWREDRVAIVDNRKEAKISERLDEMEGKIDVLSITQTRFRFKEKA